MARVTNNASCNWVNLLQVSSVQFISGHLKIAVFQCGYSSTIFIIRFSSSLDFFFLFPRVRLSRLSVSILTYVNVHVSYHIVSYAGNHGESSSENVFKGLCKTMSVNAFSVCVRERE